MRKKRKKEDGKAMGPEVVAVTVAVTATAVLAMSVAELV